jgi:hypothetical protein
MAKAKLAWTYHYLFTLQKADGQAFKGEKVKKSTRDFSHGLNLRFHETL